MLPGDMPAYANKPGGAGRGQIPKSAGEDKENLTKGRDTNQGETPVKKGLEWKGHEIMRRVWGRRAKTDVKRDGFKNYQRKVLAERSGLGERRRAVDRLWRGGGKHESRGKKKYDRPTRKRTEKTQARFLGYIGRNACQRTSGTRIYWGVV